MKVQIASITALSALFSLATPAIAGGGLISLTSSPTGPIDADQTYLVTANVQKENLTPCQFCQIEFFVQDLHPTKYQISPGSDKTDTNGNAVAKFALTANASANMVIYAQAQLPTGSYKSLEYILSFLQPSDNVSTPYPQPNMIPMTQAPVLVIDKSQPIEGNTNARQVFVSWTPVKGADYYHVRLRPSDYSNWAYPEGNPTRLNSMNLILSSNYDYYVQVESCNNSTCLTSSEYFVPKESTGGNEIKPLLGDQKIEALQNKVADLEKQVAQTLSKQGFLETQLGKIVNFLKSIFPFFK